MKRRTLLKLFILLPVGRVCGSSNTTGTQSDMALDSGSTTRLLSEPDGLAAVRHAVERQDLRRLVLDQERLQSLLEKGHYLIGSVLRDAKEVEAVPGLTIEGVLKQMSEGLVRDWAGPRPGLGLIKQHQILLGTRTEQFLKMAIEKGDVVVTGLIE